MREVRRLALVQRQALIARIARQQALRGLAQALEDEERSRALAERSRALLAAIASQPGATSGAALAEREAFAASLAKLARQASAAAQDAARQSEWQAETLAKAELRAERMAERAGQARLAVAQARERRADAAGASGLARKLQISR